VKSKQVKSSFTGLYKINNELYDSNVNNFLNQEELIKKQINSLNQFYIKNFEITKLVKSKRKNSKKFSK